jgi:hypothetical protein
MKRALPLWVAAVVPATLAGHGLAYALSGRSAADGHHAWMAPVLEVSVALLIAACTSFALDALLRAGVFAHTAAERSWFALWPRLSIAQLALFVAIEHTEGATAGLLGCAVQIFIALITAYMLYAFARLLVRCARATQAASRYLQRMLRPVTSFISRQPAPVAYALAIHAGRARFQRPPPFNVAVR